MLENGLNQNKQGSGLGLSICKNLAFKLNFKFNFESNYEEGSKFILDIPYEDSRELLDNNNKKIINRKHNLFENDFKDNIAEFFDIKKAEPLLKIDREENLLKN